MAMVAVPSTSSMRPGQRALYAGQRRHTRHLRNRRGATLVIVAITISVFIGFAALALDTSRLSSFRAELKTVADAAALSGALDMVRGKSQAQALANVQTLLKSNSIEGNGVATVVSSDVSTVSWNFGTSVASASVAWGSANAVRVITTYAVNWSLSKIFTRATSKTIADTSIAAFGGRRTHDCMKPFAIPYSAVRNQLGLAPLADTTSLTAANVVALSSGSSAVQLSRLDTVNVANPSAFTYVDVNQPGNGSPTSMVASLTAGSCLSGTLGADSTLDAKPTYGDTLIVRNQQDVLCGGAVGSTTCSGGVILVPIIDRGTNQNGTTVTTVTNTPAANQLDSLKVTSSCYSASSNSAYSSAKCSSYTNTLKIASGATPVLIHGVSCKAGPTYAGRLRVGKTTYLFGFWPVTSYTYYLLFNYTSCFTSSTTVVGSQRAAKDFHVKYVGAFVWTKQDATSIWGYFTTINYPPGTGDTWDSQVAPVTSVVLVK